MCLRIASGSAILTAALPACAQATSDVVQAQAKPAGDDAEASSSPLAEPGAAEANASPPSADIVVTAQRREQRLQEAPVAVTALSSGALEQLNIRSTSDLMTAVPSLQVSTQTAGDSGGSATFFLRGLGQQRSGNGSEPAVGIYVDDFYYPSLSGSIFDIVDLAQVEVLRGPQGTLFGRNTIGGAIRYTTRGAELGRFSGHVTGTIGRFGRYEGSAGVNVPIGDVAAIRITGGHLQRDGFVRVQTTGKTAGDTQTDLVRLQARVEPTDALYVDLSAQYSRFKLDGFSYTQTGSVLPIQPGSLAFVWNTFIAPGLGRPSYDAALEPTCSYCQYGTGSPEFSYTTYRNALATIGWTIAPHLTLKSLTGWQEVNNRNSNDLDSTPLPIYDGGIQRNRTYAFSQEVQLAGKVLDDRINFVAGGFYYNQRDPGLLPERAAVVLGGPTVATPTRREIKSYAGFIDGAAKLTDELSLLGGYRYNSDHKTIDVRSEAGAPLAHARATFGSSTFRAGLQYQWRRDIMTYANVSTGFRGGGFNPYSASSTPQLQAFDPETSTSYEAGARLQFLDRRITINPTVFYVNWDKIQVQAASLDPVTGQSVIRLQNAGKARSYGFELEYAVGVTENVRVFGNLAYLNLRYTDIGNATGITLQSDLQRAPPLTFSIGGAHTLSFASGAKVVTTLNYNFQDEQQSTPTDADSLLLPAYGVLNGRIEFTPAGRLFSVAAYMTNILDKRYAIGGVDYYTIAGLQSRIDLGARREFGLTARVNF